MNRKYYTARISIVDAYNVRLEIRDVENNLIKEPAGADPYGMDHCAIERKGKVNRKPY